MAFADRDEFCVITEAHLRLQVLLIAEGGSARTFKTGDAFLIPNGFRGFWDGAGTTGQTFIVHN